MNPAIDLFQAINDVEFCIQHIVPAITDVQKVHKACALAGIKVSAQMSNTFQTLWKDNSFGLKALQAKAFLLSKLKEADKNVQKVYNLVFVGTMQSIELGWLEKIFESYSTAHKITPKQIELYEKGKVKTNVELIKATNSLLLKQVVAAHVIPEAIALVERMQKFEPSLLANNALWKADEALEKYKEYNIG